MSVYKKNVHLSKKRICGSSRSVEKETTTECKFNILNSDSLEYISSYLTTVSALALYRSSHGIMLKLAQCPGFWKALCEREDFHKVRALKKDDEDDTERISWAGNLLHGVEIPEDATFWHKVFIRGLQMRRNVCSGNFEWWRLFTTGKENLPVKKMMKYTTNRELRSIHRRSCFNEPERRVDVNFAFNDDYFVAVQQSDSLEFKDIFIWKWENLQKPKFLYSFNLLPIFEGGLSEEGIFVYKKFLVVMPESLYVEHRTKVRSMLRVYDLSNRMTLVGSYDFPEFGYTREYRIDEDCYLKNVGNYAITLCRTPNFKFFIFSIPNCHLLHTLPMISDPERPLENDILEEFWPVDYDNETSFQLRFDHPELFESNGELFVRLLLVDFENILRSGELFIQRLDNKFDTLIVSDTDEAEFHMINETQMALLTSTAGDLIIRDMVITSPSTISFVDRLSVPSPEPIETFLNEQKFLISNDLIYVFRCFKSQKRRIHAYTNDGVLECVFEIDTPQLEMDIYISFKTNERFLCAIDDYVIAIWDRKTGQFLKSMNLPGYYGFLKEKPDPDPMEAFLDETSSNCRDFYFNEDGIIIIYSKRNFPIAADVVLFW